MRLNCGSLAKACARREAKMRGRRVAMVKHRLVKNALYVFWKDDRGRWNWTVTKLGSK